MIAKYIAYGLLTIALLLTGWLIKADLAVAGNYTGWGAPNMGDVFVLVGIRWVVLTSAFIALLWTGQLSGWARWGFLRAGMALAGVFILELFSFFLHSVFADENVIHKYRVIYAVLATLIPLAVMAGGFFGSRALFVLGVLGAIVGGMTGDIGETTYMKIKKPFLSPESGQWTMAALLNSANPLYGTDELAEYFAAIEKRPDWVEQVAGQLDGPERLTALWVLGRQPGRLDEALQERCWIAVGAATADLDKEFQKLEGHATVSEVLKLTEAVKGLSSLPGPVRDRHRAEFEAARDYVAKARPGSSQIPDLAGFDWRNK